MTVLWSDEGRETYGKEALASIKRAKRRASVTVATIYTALALVIVAYSYEGSHKFEREEREQAITKAESSQAESTVLRMLPLAHPLKIETDDQTLAVYFTKDAFQTIPLSDQPGLASSLADRWCRHRIPYMSMVIIRDIRTGEELSKKVCSLW